MIARGASCENCKQIWQRGCPESRRKPSGKGLKAEMAEECPDCRRGRTNLCAKRLKAEMAEECPDCRRGRTNLCAKRLKAEMAEECPDCRRGRANLRAKRLANLREPKTKAKDRLADCREACHQHFFGGQV